MANLSAQETQALNDFIDKVESYQCKSKDIIDRLMSIGSKAADSLELAENRIKQLKIELSLAIDENSRLREIIEGAPHEPHCNHLTPISAGIGETKRMQCDCWKAALAEYDYGE